LGFVVLAQSLSGCLSKGDTIVNGADERGSSKNDDAEPDAGVLGEDDTAEQSPAGGGGSSTTKPRDDEEPASNGGAPIGEPAGSGTGGEASVPDAVPPSADLVACAPGATPGKAAAVQLTDSTDNKKGLRVTAGAGGYLLAWQAVGATKTEVAYQSFDSALKARFDEKKLPEVSDAVSGVGLAFSANKDAFVLAHDQGNEAFITWIAPASGDLVQAPVATELVTQGRPLFVAAADTGVVFVSSMGSGAGCPGTAFFRGRLVNENTEGSIDFPLSGGCVLEMFGVVVDPAAGFGIVLQPLRTQGALHFASPEGTAAPAPPILDKAMDVTQGAVVGWDGSKLVMASVRPAGGVSYGRFKSDGTLAGSAANVSAPGKPVSLAVGADSVGVLVESASTVQFFARAVSDGTSVHPPGVVAAQKGLQSPSLVRSGGDFIVFFLAEDNSGDPQAFATTVQCVQSNW
jgi:hypothetical protein